MKNCNKIIIETIIIGKILSVIICNFFRYAVFSYWIKYCVFSVQNILQSTVSTICLITQRRKLTCRENYLFKDAAQIAEPAVQPGCPASA